MAQTTDNIHYDYEEVTVERKKTITFSTENKTIKQIEILTYLQSMKLDKNIECFQTIMKEDTVMYEITCKTEILKEETEKKLNQKICINNTVLKQIENRELKDIKKKPLITVVIYEAPCELEDIHIINKLKSYGEVKGEISKHRIRGTDILNGNRSIDFIKINESIPTTLHINYGEIKGDISRHKIRGTDILNGNRSLDFIKINESIPTTLHIKGNKIKIKYPGQDRTPVCSFCRVKGHYKAICEKFLRIQDAYENRSSEDSEENEIEMNYDENQAGISWAKIVEKNEQRNAFKAETERIRKHNNQKQSDKNDTTHKIDEIKKYNNQQIRYKSTRELTEEEIKEKKKRKKTRKEERRRKREEG